MLAYAEKLYTPAFAKSTENVPVEVTPVEPVVPVRDIPFAKNVFGNVIKIGPVLLDIVWLALL
jgi:hypothetical protein